MDLELLPWLDEAFLTAALQGGENHEPPVSIRGFSVTRAVPPGTNYLSRTFKVRVDYKIGEKEERVHLFLKTPITSGIVREIVNTGDYYGKESRMYSKVIPALNNLLKCNFAPKHYFSAVKDVLVLKDLNEKGYVMCDRRKQLDFLHCQHVCKTLAKFHASSVVCKRDFPSLIEEVSNESLYVKNANFDKEMKPWIEESLQVVGEVVREMGLGNSAAALFESRVDTAAELVVSLCRPKQKGLNVLNYGDMWVNNILFKHTSSGGIADVKLLDFQLTRYTSPVRDLVYFIWTSADEDVRENKLPEICELYRITLNSTLERLGCEERLSEEEFLQDFKDTIHWPVIIVCQVLPITVIDDLHINEDNLLNESFKNVFGGKLLLNGKNFKNLIPKLVEHLQNWYTFYK